MCWGKGLDGQSGGRQAAIVAPIDADSGTSSQRKSGRAETIPSYMGANERKLPTHIVILGTERRPLCCIVLTGYVTLGKVLNLYEPPFSHRNIGVKQHLCREFKGLRHIEPQAWHRAEPSSDKQKVISPSLPAGRYF